MTHPIDSETHRRCMEDIKSMLISTLTGKAAYNQGTRLNPKAKGHFHGVVIGDYRLRFKRDKRTLVRITHDWVPRTVTYCMIEQRDPVDSKYRLTSIGMAVKNPHDKSPNWNEAKAVAATRAALLRKKYPLDFAYAAARAAWSGSDEDLDRIFERVAAMAMLGSSAS